MNKVSFPNLPTHPMTGFEKLKTTIKKRFYWCKCR